MTKSLNDLLEDYGDACYRNSDDAIDLKIQILSRFDELIVQRSMHEEIIKSAYARCRELEQQISGRDRKPIGYLPAYVVRTISNDGAWDSFTLSRERSDPTDIEVFL